MNRYDDDAALMVQGWWIFLIGILADIWWIFLIGFYWITWYMYVDSKDADLCESD